MTDDWDFFFLLVDDEPASIFVDLGIAAEAPLISHPHMAYVRLEMRQPRPDGLSSQEEFETLRALEDHLTARIAAGCGARYVGRNTSGGGRDFYFYAADPKAFTRVAAEAMAHHPEYRHEIGDRPDPDWSVYFDFLSPGADDRQRMMNRRVRDSLEQHGDDLGLPRPIDHRAYFPNGHDAASFAARVQSMGFGVEAPKPMDEGDYAVDFARRDLPFDMDDVVIELIRIARELGGEYDGWGCEVAKPKPH